jgi:hypothetical protein
MEDENKNANLTETSRKAATPMLPSATVAPLQELNRQHEKIQTSSLHQKLGFIDEGSFVEV